MPATPDSGGTSPGYRGGGARCARDARPGARSPPPAQRKPPRDPAPEAAEPTATAPEEAPEPEIPPVHADVPWEEPAARELREEAQETALRDHSPGEAASRRAYGETPPKPVPEAAEPTATAPEEAPEPEIPPAH